MGNTRQSRLSAAPEQEHEVLRTPRPHRNEGALQRALRQERIARRRNFMSWLLTVLIAAGACAAIVIWVAGRPGRAPLSPTAATPTSIPVAPAAGEVDPVPVGAEHALPAR